MKQNLPASRRNFVPEARWVFWGLACLLALGMFAVSRQFWRCWTLTRLPGIAPAGCSSSAENLPGGPVVNAQGTRVAAPPTPVAGPDASGPPVWDGASRVNILFIGLDYRDTVQNEGPPRSDTMILFTVDPQSRTAGILSIQRDLWVNIPGIGYSRINTAYPSGEAHQFPGGGPGLAMKTVEQLIGVPIQYYGQIDFHSFEEAIDAIGGLYICIPERIRIDPIGNKPPRNLHAGCQTLPGYEVLAYARNRYTAMDDIDRSNRQQLVIMALRDQIFDPQNFPVMLARAPEIYQEASAGLRTNLSLDDALKLAVLLQQIPPENIRRGVIDYSMVKIAHVTLAGRQADVLQPVPDKIRLLRDQIFTVAGPEGPRATGEPAALMQADAARVRVSNGSGATDLGARAQEYLRSQGMNVVEVVAADRTYDRTAIILYGPKLYTLRYFLDLFGDTTQIIFKPGGDPNADVEIRLGRDAPAVFP